MSAGAIGEYPGEPPLTTHSDITLLAPKMQEAVVQFLKECDERGLHAKVQESFREHATAVAYYKRGRTQIPPHQIVTNAPDETWSWHGYGLALDVIHATKGWNAGETWFAMMGEIAQRHEMKWGGNWTHPDLPHLQWGRCRATPSDLARRLLREGGLEAVWKAVGAL